MKTQFSRPLTSVGVYALTYPKSMDTLRYGTANALWVSIEMDSRQTATKSLDFDPNLCYINNMNNSIKTKSLFSQSIDLTDDYLSLEYVKSFSSNMFDKYTRENSLDPHLAIYHYGNDRFVVQTMDYKYDGCLSGCSVQLGQFYDIYEAQDCAEDYLKDLLISQGV